MKLNFHIINPQLGGARQLIFHLSYGRTNAGSYLWIGDDTTYGKRQALIKFDLTSIPATSTINSVTLRLSVTDTAFDQITIDVHTVSADWAEGPTNPALEATGTAL